MRELTRRVEALEARDGLAAEVMDVIIVNLVASGMPPQELRTLEHGDQVWHRRDDESEDQFTERVCAAVPRKAPGVPVLLSGDPT